MEKNIEIEIRGLLTKETYEHLLSFLEKEGVFVAKRNRQVIDYSTFREGEGVRERTKDIRIRETNGVPEIIVKLGAWGGGEARKELSFFGKEGEFEKLVEIFGHLGFMKGVRFVRNSIAYLYKGVEIALVEVPGHSYYFEAEKMADSGEDRQMLEEEIRQVIEELGLTTLSKEGFFEYIEKLNNESNAIFQFEEKNV